MKKSLLFIFISITLIGCGGGSGTSSEEVSSSPWEELSLENSLDVENTSMFEIDGMLYLYGSTNLNLSQRKESKERGPYGLWRIDDMDANREWKSLATSGETPEQLGSYSAKSFNNKLWVIGCESNSMDVYYSTENRWENIPINDDVNFGYNCAVATDSVNNKVYISSESYGSGTGYMTSDFLEYDINTGEFDSFPSYNHSDIWQTQDAFVYGDDYWTVSAYGKVIKTNRQTGATQKVEISGDKPESMTNYSTAYHDGKLWVIGGYKYDTHGIKNPTKNVWRFDASTPTWKQYNDTPAEPLGAASWTDKWAMRYFQSKLWSIGINSMEDDIYEAPASVVTF